eukprot:m.321167 g.321167  ORF g.321167 m.321167 type:complete len:96 (-) comp16526_c0_seq33:136-423(-)
MLADTLAYGADYAAKKQEFKHKAQMGQLQEKVRGTVEIPKFTHDDLAFIQKELEEKEKVLRQMENLGKSKEKRYEIQADIDKKRHVIKVLTKNLS